MPYIKQRGVSDYFKTPGDWSWQFYPPPYRFANPNKAVLPTGNYYPDYAPAKYMGLGCAGSCECGGTCSKGVGTLPSLSSIDFSIQGTGIVDAIEGMLPNVLGSPLNYKIPNWAVYGLVGLLVVPKLLKGGRRR